MTGDIKIGASVARGGESFGAVEQVLKDEGTGEISAVLVRSGRADYLVRVPAQFLQRESDSRLVLVPSAPLDELEREAVESGRLPPTGEHLEDAGRTPPAPAPEQVLGRTPGMPQEYDGPSTA
jgi:hypothetical protein